MKKYLVLIFLFGCIKAVWGQDNGSIKTFADTASTIFKQVSDNKNWQLGAEVAINNTKFITPGSKNSVSTINDISIRIVLPLTNSKGKKTINIMPF